MSDRKAELERKKAKLAQIRAEKEARRKEREAMWGSKLIIVACGSDPRDPAAALLPRGLQRLVRLGSRPPEVL